MANLLVVDDNPRLRKKITSTMKEAGHTVVPAGTGEAALITLEELRPDLIICDIGLKGHIDGLQVLEAVRKKHALDKIPFILVSNVGDRSLGVISGADCFLKKPFQMRGLLAMVKYLLHPITRQRRKH